MIFFLFDKFFISVIIECKGMRGKVYKNLHMLSSITEFSASCRDEGNSAPASVCDWTGCSYDGGHGQ